MTQEALFPAVGETIALSCSRYVMKDNRFVLLRTLLRKFEKCVAFFSSIEKTFFTTERYSSHSHNTCVLSYGVGSGEGEEVGGGVACL